MKLLYEASNTIEGHMILNLLEQAGLSARIDGEYLQGGFGELPALGVRIMIDEMDYVEGKRIVQKWDAEQPKQEVTKQVTERKISYSAALIGLAVGIVVTIAYYNTPVTEDGIDYNGDGKYDEKWTYVDYRISKVEVDRNLDGDFDSVSAFDRHGLIESSLLDDDFNGTFETEVHYQFGNAVWKTSDTTGDGFKDTRVDFKHGIIEKVSILSSHTKRVIKVEEYGPFIIKGAQLDTTGDGILDTVYEYDGIGEIKKKVSK